MFFFIDALKFKGDLLILIMAQMAMAISQYLINHYVRLTHALQGGKVNKQTMHSCITV